MKVPLVACLIVAALFISFCSSRLKATSQQKPCPVSLTNPDGQEMLLEKYDLRVAIDGPLSLTEMEMVFRNPQARRMEGRFLYLLPPGATISRFAKEVDGRLMEGEVVERLRAQAVYTEILQSMRDPALLELDQGNRFSARVFPIPANGTVRLLLAYSQRIPEQGGVRKLTVPLAGIPKIGEFNYSLVVNDLPGQQLQPIDGLEAKAGEAAPHRVMNALPRKDYTPQADLEFAFKVDPASPRLRALHAGDFQMLSWRSDDYTTDFKEPVREWVFYFDTSASNADMEKRRLDAIRALLSAHKTEGQSAFAFDVEIKSIGLTQPITDRNRGSDYDYNVDPIVDALRARHALGATNLEAALKHIGDAARAAQKPQRFVLVSDGIATMGAREVHELLAALGEWPDRHVLEALVIGAKQDERVLSAIVEKTHGRIVILPLNDHTEGAGANTALEELQMPPGKSYEFYDENAAWIFPRTFRDVQPGSELVVFSQLKPGAASKAGVVARGGDNKPIDTQLSVQAAEVSDFAPLLQHEANAAYLSHLEKAEDAETKPEKRAELHKTRIEISVKNRVLCPLTSLLVLESENDYRRFGIDRAELPQVMVVGGNGIEMKKRTADLPPAPTPSDRTEGRRGLQQESAAKSKGLAADAPKPEMPESDAAKELEESVQGSREPRADAGRMRELRARDGLANANSAVEEGADKDDSTGGVRRIEAMRARAPGSSGGGAGEVSEQSIDDEKKEADLRLLAPAATAAAAPRPASAAPVVAAADPQSRAGEPHPFAQAAQQQAAQPMQAEQPGKAVQDGSPALPEWTAQNSAPTAAQLQVLHAQVAANPRDRGFRNAYANALFRAKKWDELQGQAFEWLPFDPENPQVYEYLGKSAAGLRDFDLALRAITSIAEIAPNRAALLARAGWLLLSAEKYDMAEQMFREALKNRKDDSNLYRGLGATLWLAGKFEQAAKELDAASQLTFNARYGDARRVIREELAYVVRAWAAVDAPAAGKFAQTHLSDAEMQRTDVLRATLCWETDGNDVDLHVIDPTGEECFYNHARNASGLELYSDQTQGLGPEVIRTGKTIPGKYYVGVNYFSSGPMGVSRGVVIVMKPDNGVVKRPEIVPFCLIPEGSDMRLITTVDF